MSARAARAGAACLLALLTTAARGAQAPTPLAPPADATSSTLEAAAAQWPDRVQLLPLARAGDGPPALVAALWLRQGESPPLPGLLIGDASLGRARPSGPSTEQRLARLLLALAARIDSEDETRALLSQRALYLAPRLGPLDPVAARRTFAHDFPSGWLPAGFHGANSDALPGAYPLSTPEAAALAALLAQSRDLGALALFDARAAPAEPSRLELELSARPDAKLPAQAGHPLRHAREDLGLPALALDLGAEVNDEAFAQRVLDLLRTMPRFDLDLRAVERFGPELWLLDLALSARIEGVWAEPGCLPESDSSAGCGLETGVLETAAVQRAPGAVFEALTVRANECRLPVPPVGQPVVARLLVRAPAGTEVRALVEAPRFGQRELRIPLAR